MKSILLTIVLLTLNIVSIFSQANGCATPTSLTVNSSCSTSAFTVGQNGTTSEEVNASCATGTDYSDGWYSVVGIGNTMTITISSTNFDACLAAFSSCASGELDCQMVTSGASSNNSISFSTTNGTTYYIQIQRRSGASNDDLSGNICAVSNPAGGGSNETCADAIAVTCGNSYNGTTVGASNVGETALPACAAYSPSAAGVWYVFNGDGSTVTAALCGSSYDTKLNVYSGASCASISNCVASDDDGCGTSSTVTFLTVVGTKYYILVNGYSSATGTFTLAISCCTPGVPSCPTLNSPANGATGVAQCSTLSWTAPASAGCTSVASYDIYYGTTNPPPYLANTTSTSYSITVAPSTTYYWQIVSRNGSGTSAGCTIRSFTSAAGGNPQYTMVDDANSPSPYNCVQLTTTLNDQRGCAWDINSALNFTANFSYDFTVNLGSSDGGADGMAFVMQNDPLGRCKCGTTGGALGAGGILNSVVVEIDTYLNTEDRDDGMAGVLCSGGAEPDHLDIWLNGNVNPSGGGCPTPAGARVVASAVPLTNGGSNYNIENGSNHILRIAWNAGTSTLTATIFNTALSINYGSISYSFNPMTVFGTNTPYFGFTASTGGLNNSQSFCNPGTLLPVDLMSFNTYCYENARKIYWSTASENNNAFFTLEKSEDGIHFSTLEIIPSEANKSGITNYEIEDKDLTHKTIFYRLSQTDHNGVVKTFDVIASDCSSKINSMTIESVFEDVNQLEIEVNCLEEGKHEIKIIDCTGRLVRTHIFESVKGINKVKLSKEQFQTGMYIVQLNHQSQKATKRFLIH